MTGRRLAPRALRAVACTTAALAFVHAGPGVCRAETLFSSVPAWSGPVENTEAIAVGDVDGDGKLDLVRGNSRLVSSVYLNDGAVFAATSAWHGPEEGTETIALGDVDGDGHLDLVRGNHDRGVTLYLNAGRTFASDTAWTGRVEATPQPRAVPIELADVDGDGRLDLVCGAYGSTDVYLNTGTVFTRAPVRVAGASYGTTSIALGDVDGDGRIDLVRGDRDGPKLYLNVGGMFAQAPAWTRPGVEVLSVGLGDLDGDGRLDLVCGTTTGTLLLLNRGGVFETAPTWTAPAGNVQSLALGDVDGDGRLDLVCGERGVGATAYLNVGGTLDAVAAWTGPPESISSIALADIDGDGDLDLIDGNYGQAATVYLNSSGAFTPAPTWRGAPANTHAVAFVDVDGDGAPDLVCGNFGEPPALYLDHAGVLERATWSAPSENAFALACGDVDGDGRADVVLGDQGDAAKLYRNTGGGFAVTPVRIGSVQSTSSVALGDIDRDGRLDLVRGNQSGPTTVYRNTGAGFDSTAALAANPTQGVALGDVDGDGALDLVRGNDGPPASLYLNDGNGFSAAAPWRNEPERTNAVALADVDGDGRPDLVRANSGQTTLYRNAGGHFDSTAAWSGLEEESQSVAVTDIDGDGRPDLIRGNFSSGLFVHGTTLYLNVGGTFAFAPAWTSEPEPTRSVAVGDVNGDGWPDLVCGNDMAGGPEATALYLHRAPWIPAAPDSAPHNQLPGNAAHLRWMRVTRSDPNHFRIAFRAVDLEADPLWLVGEYQFAGSPLWQPMDLGASARIGPFTTSPGGVPHEVVWDVTSIPFDRREVVIRMRAVSTPHRGGAIQFVPSYRVDVGTIVPARPEIVASPAGIRFKTMTVGDTQADTLRITNAGNENLVVQSMASPDAAIDIEVETPFTVAAHGERFVTVRLTPLAPLPAPGSISIRSNDPLQPDLEVGVTTDIRPLEIETHLLAVADALPLGEAATIVVTPKPQVHVSGGTARYRPRLPDAPFTVIPLVPQGSNFIALIPGEDVTEAGLDYYVQVQNGAAAPVTDPLDAPASTFHQDVSSPIAIAAAPQPDTSGGFPAGRSTPVVVSLPAGSIFRDGALYYRLGGAATFDSVAMDSARIVAGAYAAAIPGVAVGPRGVEYWARVSTQTKEITDPAVGPGTHPRSFACTVPNLAEPQEHVAGRYRMFSIPLDFGPSPPATVEAILFDQLGSYDPTSWRSFRWDSTGYVEPPQAAAASGVMSPVPGRAFWLVTRSPYRIDTAPIVGHSTIPGVPYRLALQAGWNQIGDPFDFPVAWSDVRTEGPAGAVVEPPVRWNDAASTYDTATVSVLQPFEGYWVHCDSPGVDLLISPIEDVATGLFAARGQPAAAPDDAPPDTAAWRVRISAACGAASDVGNAAGVALLASDGADRFDRSDPPLAPGPAISLYFVPDDGTQRTIDVRGEFPRTGDPSALGQRWAFDVASTLPGDDPHDVRLDFTGVDRVPPDLDVRLVDRVLARTIDLRVRPTYSYASAARGFVRRPSATRFELQVGTRAYIDHARPAERSYATRLLPMTPDPIARGGVVRFETAVAGAVALSIFDVSGRKVRELVRGTLDRGAHEVAWHGDDDDGRALAPGVYLLRLAATGRSDTGKIVKIR